MAGLVTLLEWLHVLPYLAGLVTLLESVFLILMYVVYVIFMYYNTSVMAALNRCTGSNEAEQLKDEDEEKEEEARPSPPALPPFHRREAPRLPSLCPAGGGGGRVSRLGRHRQASELALRGLDPQLLAAAQQGPLHPHLPHVHPLDRCGLALTLALALALALALTRIL